MSIVLKIDYLCVNKPETLWQLKDSKSNSTNFCRSTAPRGYGCGGSSRTTTRGRTSGGR